MNGISELDGESIHEVLRDEFRGVLIDFWSPWCSPCRSLRPHLHKMAEEREARWRFVAINTEAHPKVAEEFGVQSLPTIVLYRRGEELHRFAGSALVSSIDQKLDEFT